MKQLNIAPGVRLSLRGEDFLVTKVKVNETDKTNIIFTEGISDLVKGKRYIFDSKIDSITNDNILNPINTKLIVDNGSNGYQKTKLFIETHIRNSSSISKKIEIADKTAIEGADFQFEPTLKAFKLPRPRILIADGVGLGKTVEAGILMAELIKRGKGQRILVVALKSILKQFQQEIWNRFAIPLVRLDSVGINKIKAELPINKNPFEYYDKTIISIDTLKNNAKFKHYLEKSRWDIIVIDEVHTVANASSLRGSLAAFLAERCESLIYTSATPHNGKRESFANIISMLEPTAISRSGNYGKKEVEPYYVRRFKNDLKKSAQNKFKDREVKKLEVALEPSEITFLEFQQEMKISALKAAPGRKQRQDLLFAVRLFKSYMSSPEACLLTIKNKIATINESENPDTDSIASLQTAQKMVEKIIDEKGNSKFKELVKALKEIKWQGKKNNDRIIIFSERIETLKTLQQKLSAEFSLKEETVAFFHGGLNDVVQQEVIEDFGKEDSKIRLFLTSDAGAQGVNLHYYCHTMFNYDIPWSIITLEQRNGRIDRFGQNKTPIIYYILAKSDLEELKTDLHIVHNLLEKENEVYNTLGDSGSIMKLYDPKKENEYVEHAIETGNETYLDGNNNGDSNTDDDDYLSDSFFDDDEDETTEIISEVEPFTKHISFYQNDFNYYENLSEYLKAHNLFKDNELVVQDNKFIEVLYTKELKPYLYDLPKEAKPALNKTFKLTTDKKRVEQAITRARKKKGEWSEHQIMYDLHPIIKIMMSKLESTIPKDHAPVCKIDKIPANQRHYLFHAQITNKLGQPILSEFYVARLDNSGALAGLPISFDQYVKEHELDKKLIAYSISSEEVSSLESGIKDAIDPLKLKLDDIKIKLQDEMKLKQEIYKKQLDDWFKISTEQLSLFETEQTTIINPRRKEKEEGQIKTILDEKSKFYEDMTSLNNDPYFKLLAVFFNNNV